MKRALASAAVFGCLWLLSACAVTSLPVSQGNNAVLVIPKTIKNTSFSKWVRRYMVVISKHNGEFFEEVMTVGLSRNSDNYQVVEDLAPGYYQMSRVTWATASKWRGTKAMGEGYSLNIPFNLSENSLTILPYDFYITQIDRGAGVWSSFNKSALLESKQKAITQELKLLDNAADWGL